MNDEEKSDRWKERERKRAMNKHKGRDRKRKSHVFSCFFVRCDAADVSFFFSVQIIQGYESTQAVNEGVGSEVQLKRGGGWRTQERGERPASE